MTTTYPEHFQRPVTQSLGDDLIDTSDLTIRITISNTHAGMGKQNSLDASHFKEQSFRIKLIHGKLATLQRLSTLNRFAGLNTNCVNCRSNGTTNTLIYLPLKSITQSVFESLNDSKRSIQTGLLLEVPIFSNTPYQLNTTHHWLHR